MCHFCNGFFALENDILIWEKNQAFHGDESTFRRKIFIFKSLDYHINCLQSGTSIQLITLNVFGTEYDGCRLNQLSHAIFADGVFFTRLVRCGGFYTKPLRRISIKWQHKGNKRLIKMHISLTEMKRYKSLVSYIRVFKIADLTRSTANWRPKTVAVDLLPPMDLINSNHKLKLKSLCSHNLHLIFLSMQSPKYNFVYLCVTSRQFTLGLEICLRFPNLCQCFWWVSLCVYARFFISFCPCP